MKTNCRKCKKLLMSKESGRDYFPYPVMKFKCSETQTVIDPDDEGNGPCQHFADCEAKPNSLPRADFKKWSRTINLQMLKEKCAGCKHEISCWTLYHDGLDCYVPKEESR